MTLKVKFRTLFPALVSAASPLTLVKTGLSYAFGIDIDALKASLVLAPGGSSGQLQYNNAGVLDAVAGATTSATTVLALAPTTGTTKQGVTVTQTLPSGSAGINNPYSANRLFIVNGGYQTPPGGASDPFGLFPVVSGFRVDYQSAGSGAGQFPIQIGGLFATKATSRGQQLVGLNGTIYTNIDSAGEDAFWSVIGYANVGPAANIKSVYGLDAEVATSGSATIINRVGVMSTSQGAGKGSAIDTAFGVTALEDKYGAPLPFNNLMVLWTADGVNPPLGPAGSLIVANSAFSMGYGINLPNVTFATKIFDFGSTKFQMDGSGNATFGPTSIGLGTNTISVGGTVGIQSTSGSAFKVGQGTITNPLFNVDASTASAVAGISVVGAATGGTVAINATDSGSNASISINPKGSGTATIVALRSTNAVLTTPNLGTPSAITLTSGTGLPTTGLTGTLQAAQEPAHTGDMTNTAGSLATTVVGINGDNQTTAWTTYTPTVTAGSGTFTTVSATGRWRRIGKTVFAQADITITTAGTAASTLFASLPLTAAAFNYAGSAIEITAGKSGATRIAPSGTTMGALDASATTFIANGKEVVMTTVYEIP